MRVLFFCQDNSTVEHLTLGLRLRWPDTAPLVAHTGTLGLQAIEQKCPDLVMLCNDLPDMGMLSAIREIRRFSHLPVVVVADSRSEDEDAINMVKAIDLGADEYIRLPCNLVVLMARIAAILRRYGSVARNDQGPVQCGELLINPATYEVSIGSRRIFLTPTEFRLLYLLARNRQTTVPQELIQRTVWADDDEENRDRLKKYIGRLRRKLGDDSSSPVCIKTIHGVGYRLVPRSAPEPEHVAARV